MTVMRPLSTAAVPVGTPFGPRGLVLLASDGHAATDDTDDTAALARWLADRLGARLAVMAGSTGRAVCDAARERDAAFVVVGSGRHRVLERLVGSTALDVVRHSTAPVLAAARHRAPWVRRAVVGIDFSASSVEAARTALALVAPLGDDPARLILVHVSPWGDTPTMERPHQTSDDEAALVRLHDELRATAPAGVAIETRYLAGDVAESLCTVADAAGADLLAVGTHGPAWIERLLIGSVAEAVLHNAHTHVLVCPSQACVCIECE